MTLAHPELPVAGVQPYPAPRGAGLCAESLNCRAAAHTFAEALALFSTASWKPGGVGETHFCVGVWALLGQDANKRLLG